MNNNTSLNSNVWKQIEPILNVISVMIYIICFLAGVVGNGIVIWITGFKMKKSTNTIWYLNLAIADIFYSILLPFFIIKILMNQTWVFGKEFCKITHSCLFLCMYASVFHLTTLSIDRLVLTMLPIWYQNHRTVKFACTVSLATWALCIALISPYFAFYEAAVKNNKTYCVNNFNPAGRNATLIKAIGKQRQKAMIVTRFVLGFIIPLLIITVCHMVLAVKVKYRHNVKSSKAFKVMVAVIVSFFLCWLPYHMINISLINAESNTISKVFSALSFSLACINCFLNPILYVFIGQRFKETFRKSITAICESAFTEDSFFHSFRRKTGPSLSSEMKSLQM
ncbi:C3a anaphylatoxin chemotactic receptor-like [Protopterus annectens]|uniref:C3a anaphylatoxin chemotactic receptor-like n=1 Tax=Protopterus annectens TaxID=7888 RepID=UPI001CFB2BAC|nr:C3a anaphylatoxin chemotactic receptor-like [Protopterus annectens]